ncbi:hypothetical protein BU17DRAFT_85441 [Hysterangium stoloniferum]|nr:hypothetical protein BU17DRAFT_85441 [Hysterangium stoloniferum]
MAALAVLYTVAAVYVARATILSLFHRINSLALLSFLFLTHQLSNLPISADTIPFYILDFAIFVLCVALSPAQVLLFRREAPDRKKTAITTYRPNGNSPSPDGHSENTIDVDIVAVHGLASNPETTWESRKPSQSPSVPGTTAAAAHDPSSNPEITPKLSWLRDVLPNDILNARIMNFSHNTAWQGNSLSKSLHDHADDLLRALEWERRTPEAKRRPLIFIGHSFGGLIIKQNKALLNASREEDNNIRKLVQGFIFLGTPHKGARVTWIGKLISVFGFWNGSSTTLLEDLESGSPTNWKMHQEFTTFLTREGCGLTHTLCVFEAVQESFYGISITHVVDKESAVIDGSLNIGFVEKHRGIQKLSQKDDNYNAILLTLTRWVQEVADSSLKRQAEMALEKTQEEKDCLKSLSFSQMYSRSHDINAKRPGNRTWILDHDDYKRWFDGQRGLLWIRGKPGAGKSTALNNAFQTAKAAHRKEVVASFFFFRRGDPTQNSLVSLFRSLLHQILDKDRTALAQLTEKYKNKRTIHAGEVTWHEDELKDFMQTIITDGSAARSIRIYVDALDEAAENVASTVVSYFRPLTVGANLSICFTCRHYPPLAWDNELTILAEEENCADIETYVRENLEHELNDENQAQELITLITTRASGIFLWVFLVVREITEFLRVGKTKQEITEMVQKLPLGLGALYEEILEKITERKQSLHLIQWICFAQRPLSLGELRAVMSADADSPLPSDSDEQMKKRLTSLSGGLIEVGEENNVRFIHQSVPDYLLRRGVDEEKGEETADSGTERLKSGFEILERVESFDSDKTASRAHLRLAKSCLNYLHKKV